MTTTTSAEPGRPAGGGSGGQMQIRNTVLITVGILVLAVIIVVFSLASTSTQSAPVMPALTGKGLQYAVTEAKDANWTDVNAYDATGRDRRLGDQTGWQVCFQYPAPGHRKAVSTVNLGAAQTDEPCPAQDFGVLAQVYKSSDNPGTNRVPNLTDFTPYMARKAFGDDASIRVLQLAGGASTTPTPTASTAGNFFSGLLNTGGEITGGLGDWRICQQDLPAGSVWDGRVLTLRVVDYAKKCP